MKQFEAIIFDLDGTLIDTAPDIARSMNNILLKMGCSILPVTDFYQYVGKGTWFMAEQLSQKMNIQDPQSLHKQYLDEYKKNLAVLSKPFNGIENILNFCADCKFSIAVVTNKHHDMTLSLLNQLLPQQVFSQVIGFQDGQPKKPDPFTALKAAGLMNIQPENCLFVGDTSIDLLTAKNAGMQSAAVLWGYSTRNSLIQHMPNYIFTTVLDLQNFVVTQAKMQASSKLAV